MTFKATDLVADYTAMGVPQVLWNGHSTGFDSLDCTYPSSATTSSGLLLSWYCQLYNQSPAKLYTMTGSYQLGATTAVTGSITGGAIH